MLNLTYRILQNRIPSFNRRSHNETDFHRIRRAFNCDFIEKTQDRAGYYVTDISGDYIFIDKRIGGMHRTEVLFHELVHLCLHYPCRFLHHKQQFEAELFALILLIPKKDLFDAMQINFEELDLRMIPYLKKRKYIFERFGV